MELRDFNGTARVTARYSLVKTPLLELPNEQGELYNAGSALVLDLDRDKCHWPECREVQDHGRNDCNLVTRYQSIEPSLTSMTDYQKLKAKTLARGETILTGPSVARLEASYLNADHMTLFASESETGRREDWVDYHRRAGTTLAQLGQKLGGPQTKVALDFAKDEFILYRPK